MQEAEAVVSAGSAAGCGAVTGGGCVFSKSLRRFSRFSLVSGAEGWLRGVGSRNSNGEAYDVDRRSGVSLGAELVLGVRIGVSDLLCSDGGMNLLEDERMPSPSLTFRDLRLGRLLYGLAIPDVFLSSVLLVSSPRSVTYDVFEVVVVCGSEELGSDASRNPATALRLFV